MIDILIPADLTDGYLWVGIADVSGNFYNLLPNITRPDASLRARAAERDDPPGPRGLQRRRIQGGPPDAAAFTVDANFGKSGSSSSTPTVRSSTSCCP